MWLSIIFINQMTKTPYKHVCLFSSIMHTSSLKCELCCNRWFFKNLFNWYSNHIWVLWWHLVTFKLCTQLTASPIHFLALEICANYAKSEHYHSILYLHRFFYIFEGFLFVRFFFLLLGFILRTLKWDTIGCHALPVGFRPFVKLESLVWNHWFWTDHL